ncbi:PREDICTED: serine carboxypeptidase-like 17 isoform X1 [Nicotiana attenuata]|uniref:Serine carboxypeptidase-like 18 n=1 Tax=Nicotiana attenuata TaxID=49451 RepID=A0A314L4G4_NICAT|nr:PREDICTED: serine carboxypeptidase-like 17 isoform X1 [Nicotiana attenuata]OIT36611.1 serine carboxypeptidase-like 18 [Nicotiana attenuata]
MEFSKMCLYFSNLYYTFLFFFVLLEISPQLVVAGSPVKYLPGFKGPLPFELETGYIGVGEADEVQLYYYFVKSQSNPKVDPLILWFTGGPGCSTLNAIALQLGPMMFDDREYNGSLPTLSSNPYAYTKVANVIFVDFPVGTGFSYATTVKSNHSNNLQAGDHAYQFLRKWLITEHPEYLNNPFYVGGDSYSGITLPIVTQVISDGIDAGIKPWIDLKGYILGNPVTIIPDEHNYKIPYAHGMGLISDELYKSLKGNCGGEYNHINPSNTLCSRDMRTFNWLLKGIVAAHILEPNCDQSLYGSRRSLARKLPLELNIPAKPGVKCLGDWLHLSEIWANDENVREALHVRKGTIGAWEKCRSNLPFTMNVNNTISYHAYLSTKGLKSLIYSGDHDMMTPFISTQAWIKSLNYSIADDWRPWIVNGQVAGYTRSFSNQMTFATLKGAGHTAPTWAPAECLAMLKRWLSNKPL